MVTKALKPSEDPKEHTPSTAAAGRGYTGLEEVHLNPYNMLSMSKAEFETTCPQSPFDFRPLSIVYQKGFADHGVAAV